MIIDDSTPVLKEVTAFFAIGVPAVLLGWLVASVIEALSPEPPKPSTARVYSSLQKWLFLRRTPLGEWASPARVARFRIMARIFRYFPASLLGIWALRIILRMVH